jgi:peptidoglycan DL-endopeptidase CwlO
LKRKIIALNTTIMLGLSSIFAIPAAQASVKQLEGQKAHVEKQRSGLKAKIGTVEEEIAGIQTEQKKITDQIKRINLAIKDNNLKIDETIVKIDDTMADIEELNNDVDVIKDRIAKRNVILKERALSFQESGGSVNYLEVVLGSSSFGDFIDRVGAVATIVEADNEILAEHEADKKELEDKKNSVEKKLSSLNEMKTELIGMKAQIEEQKAENVALSEQLQKKEKENQILKASLAKKDAKLASQVASILNDIKLEKQRQTELEAARQRVAAEANTNNQTSGGSTNRGGSVVYKDTYTGSGKISDVISAGYKYIGNSVYVWGGGRNASDVANGRFDCSGFVSWAFGQAGVRVGAHTDLLANTGRAVSYSEARPGDIVFFDTYKKNGHVGIYLGNGKFIGSQGSTGVAIADMSSGYYAKKFSGHFRRILNN